MAQVLRTRRSHVSITLSSLRARGYIEDRLGRVVNESRRRRVYFLTHKGYARAMLLKGQYLKRRVRVRHNGSLITVRVEELQDVLGESHPLAEILSCVTAAGVLDPRSLVGEFADCEPHDSTMEHERRNIKEDSGAVAALHILL